jgi:GT2 family glycosyltransferase
MNVSLIMTGEDSTQLCKWVMNLFAPRRVLIVSGRLTSLVQEFLRNGIPAVELIPAQRNSQSLEAKGINDSTREMESEPFDLVLAGEDALNGINDFLSAGYLGKIGPGVSILVIFSLTPGRFLAPAAGRMLANVGFSRDLRIEKSIADRLLVYSYSLSALDTGQVIENYESALWRMTQQSQKRRLLLADFRQDIYREISAAQQYKQMVKEWENRWEAFQNSRTGKAIQALQKVRRRIFPAGSLQARLAGWVLLALHLVRSEGAFGFLKQAPRRVYKRVKWQYAMLKLRFSVSRSTSREGEISAVETRPALDTHTQSVDIIVCVHNALDDVVRCLESIQAHTSQPYHLILVDDGSGLETAAFLSRYAAEHQADLLRSDQATGYTYAANRGLRISTAEFVVLLNSDTIVTDAWLDRMVSCALSNPAIGIVGPLSNTASWQSIPRIEENGDWAENPLPEDISIETMGKLVAENSARHYLKMPFLNGFCLLMKRQVIQKVGLFDEEIFGVGYGEEDDLSLRARAAGWQLALADDVYIYHAQSKSYSTERRKALSQRATKALLKKHGEAIIQVGVDFCSHNRVLEGIRARAAQTMDRYTTVRQGMRYEGKKVLFLVPITSPGGGMNVIRAESLAMQKMGVQVTFFNLIENRELFSQAYPEVEIPTLYGMIEDIPLIASQYDAVIATYNPTVGWLCGVDQEEGKPVLGYYVQDFEPLMYPLTARITSAR